MGIRTAIWDPEPMVPERGGKKLGVVDNPALQLGEGGRLGKTKGDGVEW